MSGVVSEGLVIEREAPREGVLIVHIAGEIDLASQADLDAALLSARDHASRAMILDLSNVEFMDSSGIHSLIRAHEASEARGVSFVLAAAHHSHRTLDAAGLSDFFTFAESVSDALAGFDGARTSSP